MGSDCLIIDDVEPALALLSDWGRATLTAHVHRIRDAVFDFASRRNWTIAGHGKFNAWACDQARLDGLTWLVLDPLFSVDRSDACMRRMRLSRQFDENKSIVQRTPLRGTQGVAADLGSLSGSVAILDDAVASGRTIRHAAELAGQAGLLVQRVLVCASARSGREAIAGRLRIPEWSEYAPGDWMTMHLRDGCPFLPFAGKPARLTGPTSPDGGSVEVRVRSSDVVGHPWQILMMDRKVKEAVRDAQHRAVAALQDLVGHVPTIADVAHLGSLATAVVRPDADVRNDATLSTALPA
jgi:hypothetical protein